MVLDSQTNKVFISECTFEQYPIITRRLLNLLEHCGVSYDLLRKTLDGWCRDYMPIQVGKDHFVQYRYYPNYMLNPKDCAYITDPTAQLEALGIRTTRTDIIIDGGNVIKCADCVIMTDKVFRENIHTYSKERLVNELENLFQCDILFLPWDDNEKYGHSDGIVRYLGGNDVLMTNYYDFDRKMADVYYDKLSRRFNVKVLSYDVEKVDKYSWAYINFLQTKDIIVIPAFGREEDNQAKEQIEACFPQYKGKIFQVRVNGYVKDGGALNCVTWNILE